jgi:hypothetical protein
VAKPRPLESAHLMIEASLSNPSISENLGGKIQKIFHLKYFGNSKFFRLDQVEIYFFN